MTYGWILERSLRVCAARLFGVMPFASRRLLRTFYDETGMRGDRIYRCGGQRSRLGWVCCGWCCQHRHWGLCCSGVGPSGPNRCVAGWTASMSLMGLSLVGRCFADRFGCLQWVEPQRSEQTRGGMDRFHEPRGILIDRVMPYREI